MAGLFLGSTARACLENMRHSRARFDLVVNTLTKHAATRGAIDLFGGEQWRPVVHVDDVVSAFVSVLEAPAQDVSGEVFNVGSNHQFLEAP